MKTRNALRVALTLSGKYDLPTKLKVKGRDMYGNEVEEEIPEVDTERMERDIDAILAKESQPGEG